MLKYIFLNNDGFAKIEDNEEYSRPLTINTERVTRIVGGDKKSGIWSRMHYDNGGDGFKYVDFKHDHTSAIIDYFNNPSLIYGYTAH